MVQLTKPADLDVKRKRREGLRDTGLCACRIYFRLACRTYCLKTGERHG